MSGNGAPTIFVDGEGARVAIVASRWHTEVMDGLIAGAQAALAEIDIEAIVREATAGIAPMVEGLSTNGAWAQADPDHMVTYGLVAQYGMDQALDAMDEVEAALAVPPAPPVPPIPSET